MVSIGSGFIVASFPGAVVVYVVICTYVYHTVPFRIAYLSCDMFAKIFVVLKISSSPLVTRLAPPMPLVVEKYLHVIC